MVECLLSDFKGATPFTDDNFRIKKLTLATEVQFKVFKKEKSSEFNPRHDGDLFGWPFQLFKCLENAKDDSGRNAR